jgi:hypothetical protein
MATIGRADVTCRPLAVSNTSPAAGTPDIFVVRLVEWEKKNSVWIIPVFFCTKQTKKTQRETHNCTEDSKARKMRFNAAIL